MAVDPAFLANLSMFATLDDDERAVLAAAMQERAVKADECLFQIGEPGDEMFIVERGKIELYVKDKAGQKIVLHVAEVGEFFGELSLLDGGARTATASALDDGELLVVDREDLAQLFRKRPDAALDMLAAMSRMTRKSNALLQARVSRNVNDREEIARRDNVVMRTADWIANFSGSITFLVLHVIFFAAWICFNTLPIAFDPFPYNLLTMVVSLEAIILSTLLLFSGNRQTTCDRIRSDIEYEVNLKAELEVAHLHEKSDRMREEMLERFARIEKSLGIAQRPGKQGVGVIAAQAAAATATTAVRETSD
jgi:CRP/FNR family transcriptional regulator, cyclic AMP receptor protein